jgi:hypothetical protein
VIRPDILPDKAATRCLYIHTCDALSFPEVSELGAGLNDSAYFDTYTNDSAPVNSMPMEIMLSSLT